MKHHIKDGLQVFVALLFTGSTAFAMQPTTAETSNGNAVASQIVTTTPEVPPTAVQEPAQAPEAEKAVTWQDNPNKCNLDTQYIAQDAPFACIDKPAPTASAAPAVAQSASNNEAIAWNFLINQGYTRHQAAGIMGNLQQEHNFKTDDVPGGLGIAQWMGGRRANLMARGDYLNINVQLQFLVDELNGPESAAKAAIVATNSVDRATLAFSTLFERCGQCHNEQRISYAYAILNRY